MLGFTALTFGAYKTGFDSLKAPFGRFRPYFGAIAGLNRRLNRAPKKAEIGRFLAAKTAKNGPKSAKFSSKAILIFSIFASVWGRATYGTTAVVHVASMASVNEQVPAAEQVLPSAFAEAQADTIAVEQTPVWTSNEQAPAAWQVT